MRKQKPNILLIMSDEHAAWATGAYGHKAVKTPHIDALASRGVTFDNAYCNSPICGPSRMSFMTGQFPHRIGAWDNGKPLASDIPTWAHYLTTAGYQTALSGKMHFQGPDQLHGFERQLAKDHTDPRIKPGSFDVFKLHDPMKYYECGVGRNPRADGDDEAAARAVEFLLGGAGRDSSRPFALCVSFFVPHFPLLVDEALFYQYWPDHADLPEIPEGYLERQHPVWQALRRYLRCDTQDESAARRARAAYYGLCTYMDRLVGQVMEALQESGEAGNTIVVYLSDHGEHVGGHGLWWKRSFLEESARIPLIISAPGRFLEGVRRPQVVSLVDLAATLLDWGGTEPIAGELNGTSLEPLLRESSAQPPLLWPDLAISEYVGTDEAFGRPDDWLLRQPRRMVRQGRYKLNYFVGASPELYDLQADPGEWRDLAGDSAYAHVVEALTAIAVTGWLGDRVDRLSEESREDRRLILQAERSYLGPAYLGMKWS